LFALPHTQTSIQQANWVEYQPLTSILGNAPIEVYVTGTGEDYLDMTNVMLYVRAKVTTNTGADMGADSTAAPVNLLFTVCLLKPLNGTLISSSTNTYPYRSMLETLLSYGEAAKKSQLISELYYKDDADRMEETIVEEAGGHVPNSSLQKRREFVARSREFDMIGRIHGDIFFQERYMLNEVGMRIKLARSRDTFCLMRAIGTKINVTHASLFVRKVKLSPTVFLAHAKALENSTAKYHVKRVVCKAFAIPQNYLDANYESVFSGQLLTRIVVGLVDNRAFNGDRTRKPFNFQHFDLSEILLYLDGQQQHALRPIQPNFGNGLCVRADNRLFASTSKLNHDEGNHILREDFA